MTTTLTKSQVKDFGPIEYEEHGHKYRIRAHVRYDDQCGNGHNTFAITGQINMLDGKYWREDSGGCIHEEIAKHFPDLAPLIKWHLCSSDGPMHYGANAAYFAGERDCWGLLKGEFKQRTSRGQQNNGVAGVPCWKLRIPGTREVYATEKPAPVTLEWEPQGIEGEGKARVLDAARHAAIWPDATDDELMAPGLEQRLAARLPALMAEFRKAVESLGFTY